MAPYGAVLSGAGLSRWAALLGGEHHPEGHVQAQHCVHRWALWLGIQGVHSQHGAVGLRKLEEGSQIFWEMASRFFCPKYLVVGRFSRPVGFSNFKAWELGICYANFFWTHQTPKRSGFVNPLVMPIWIGNDALPVDLGGFPCFSNNFQANPNILLFPHEIPYFLHKSI